MGSVQMGLSSRQRDVLRQYLNHFQNGDIESRDPLKLLLVVSGEKPGTAISPLPWDNGVEGDVLECIDQFGLVHGQIPPTSAVYVSRDHHQIDSLPSEVRNEPEYHRSLGRFFGYPEEAIEYFIEYHPSDRTPPEELVAEGVFDAEEMAYSGFVYYMPIDTIDGYRRAIDHGQSNRKHLHELAHHWDLPALQDISDAVYNLFVEEMSTPMNAARPQ